MSVYGYQGGSLFQSIQPESSIWYSRSFWLGLPFGSGSLLGSVLLMRDPVTSDAFHSEDLETVGFSSSGSISTGGGSS